MNCNPEGHARAAGGSARPHRLHRVDGTVTILDVILAGTAITLALAILLDPTAGPIDGRHLLMGAALAVLATRATRR
ncbi:hypothetical protein GCM10009592_26760 [Brachybacterium rhamnosum]|uniref:Uncharacterized protein n=1 Tax=Brachybacterium rhamnosum TaxID=173361 RepID=A0ABW4Q3B5_9MICO